MQFGHLADMQIEEGVIHRYYPRFIGDTEVYPRAENRRDVLPQLKDKNEDVAWGKLRQPNAAECAKRQNTRRVCVNSLGKRITPDQQHTNAVTV